jgi:RPA family protein
MMLKKRHEDRLYAGEFMEKSITDSQAEDEERQLRIGAKDMV